MRESEQREAFAAAVRVCVHAGAALAQVDKRIASLEDTIAHERAVHFQALAQVAFLHALEDERILRKEAAGHLAKTKAAMESAQLAWLEARRDVRLVEVLETKARGIHQHELEREEQALLDDRTNALFARAS